MNVKTSKCPPCGPLLLPAFTKAGKACANLFLLGWGLLGILLSLHALICDVTRWLCVCVEKTEGRCREDHEGPAAMDDMPEVQEVGSSVAPGRFAVMLAGLFDGVAFTSTG